MTGWKEVHVGYVWHIVSDPDEYVSFRVMRSEDRNDLDVFFLPTAYIGKSGLNSCDR